MRQYIVDAFTNKIFSGNPAAVCVMDQWPEEKWMMQLANKDTIIAYQASKRGGTLYCHISGNARILISGEAVLFAISEIQE